MKRWGVLSIVLLASLRVPAQETTPVRPDTVVPAQALQRDSKPMTKKTSLFSRVLSYFNESNKEKKQKKFDFSVIGGPHFSTDAKLGLGIVASGLYRTSGTDSLQIPSNVSLYTDFSTVGFYMLGIRGTHIFPSNKQRIDYNTSFFYFPSYFWGMGYEMGDDNSNKSKMKRFQFKFQANWLFSAAENLFL
ncbi:MAG: hypothetical protein ACFNMD_06345, partial [Prevotella sp.]